MGPIANFEIGPVELWGWGLQLLLIGLVALRTDAKIRLRRPGLSFCLLMISLAWIYRLAHLFALASNGFLYWIGDDPHRWLTAWEWANSPDAGLLATSTWLPGTYYLHGLAMMLISNPLYASKLVSAVYSVLSLAGVFAFALAVFRHRGLAILSVAFLAPFWIDILSSGGTMTEMPTTGAILGGVAALIAGLRLAPQPRRVGLLTIAGLLFAIATTFHLAAWIQLTGILLFVLPVFLREEYASVASRFRSWVLLCGLSTSWCFVWALDQWRETGSPFTLFGEAASMAIFKIGGATHLFQRLSRIATAGEVAIVLMAALSLIALVTLAFWTSAETDTSRSGGAPLSKLRRFMKESGRRWLLLWGAGGIALVVCLLARAPIERWISLLPPALFDRLMVNAAIFPVSLAYCLHYFLPLVVCGAIVTLFVPDGRLPHRRIVFLGIAWVLVIFVLTALNGGANLSPFRTVVTLAAALVPFSLAPLLDLDAGGENDACPTKPHRNVLFASLGILVVLLIQGHNVFANASRVDSELPVPSILRSADPLRSLGTADIAALGTWIRSEIVEPGNLRPENLAQPFELVLAQDVAAIGQMLIEYHVGDPGRFGHPYRIMRRTPEINRRLIAGLKTNQILIANHAVVDPRLRLVTRIGRFVIYETMAR